MRAHVDALNQRAPPGPQPGADQGAAAGGAAAGGWWAGLLGRAGPWAGGGGGGGAGGALPAGAELVLIDLAEVRGSCMYVLYVCIYIYMCVCLCMHVCCCLGRPAALAGGGGGLGAGGLRGLGQGCEALPLHTYARWDALGSWQGVSWDVCVLLLR